MGEEEEEGETETKLRQTNQRENDMCRNPSSKNQEETNSSARNLRSAYYLGSVETNEGYSESAVWLPAQTFAYREFPIAFFLSSDSRRPRAAKPMRVCPDFSGAYNTSAGSAEPDHAHRDLMRG